MAAAVGSAAAQLMALAQAAQAADAPIVPVDPSTYVPSPLEPSWQVWFGAFVGVVPFVIGAYEFTKRILIQRRCKACDGRGLILKGKYPKKCPECGGMFPWISWRMFLAANATPGNGGPLMQPRGQTSIFYTVPPPPERDPASGARSPPPGARTDSEAATGASRDSGDGDQRDGAQRVAEVVASQQQDRPS